MLLAEVYNTRWSIIIVITGFHFVVGTNIDYELSGQVRNMSDLLLDT